MKRALLLTALGALLSVVPACHHDENAVLLVVVTASGSPPAVASLDVTVSSPAGMSSNRYTRDGQEAIAFPTTLSAQLPSYATGEVSVDVRASDAAGTTIASGHEGPFTIHAGERRTVYVRLDCEGGVCVVDGGTGDDDGGMPMPNPHCGNGRVDPGERCDTGIAQGAPGACPASCDDHIPCTKDTASGSACTLVCKHDEIRDPIPGDGCCPGGTSYDGPTATDSDCSPTCGNGVVDKDETCDMGILRGMTGACPTTMDCQRVTCADSMLISGGTCSAVCVHYPIVEPSGKDLDSCCPPGATYTDDADCTGTCGNGIVDSAELCDVGILPPAQGACPTSCDDGISAHARCTLDYFVGTGCARVCQHFLITTPISGDGCCPEGATNATDSDCPPECGNNVLERGETCEVNSCPTGCPPPPRDKIGRLGCLRNELVGDPATCTARCEITEITACDLSATDGCCPAHCTAANDFDCAPRCGDGVVENTKGEECDIAVTTQTPDRCPTSCDDHKLCTEDRLVSEGTCSAHCMHLPITQFRAGDGCCPKGANFYLDPDCTPSCGDGVVDRPAELCDYAAGVAPGASGCPGPDTCPTDDYCANYVVTGLANECSAACVSMPITGCKDDDKCCPPGCNPTNDNDCPTICGDGVVENGEGCDRAITAGAPGACARSCDDGNACTFDQSSGSIEGCSRSCSHTPITACISDDGCCPAGCSAVNDRDCDSRCDDRHVGAGETCDPPSTCPTSCPDDGDPCTVEQLTGEAAMCNVVCRHVPVTTCSGTKADSCCPTGCTPGTDSDC